MTTQGWYADRTDSSQVRYRDGFAWTEQVETQSATAPAAPVAPLPAPAPSGSSDGTLQR